MKRERNPNARLAAERERAREEGRARSEGMDVESRPLPAPKGREEVLRMARESAEDARERPHKPTAGLREEKEAIEREAGTGRPREAEKAHAREVRKKGMTPAGGQPGISAVVAAVEDVDFPTTRDEMERTVGDRKVEIMGDVKPSLREVLRKAGGGRFESMDDFKTTLHKNWDAVKTLAVDRGISGGRGKVD